MRPMMTSRKPPISYGLLAPVVGFRLQRLWGQIAPLMTRRMQKWQLGRGSFTLMGLIQANPGMTQTALAREAAMSKVQLVPVLHVLTERGLVERREHSSDRRNNHLYLTAEGELVTYEMADVAAQLEMTIRNALSPEAYANLLSGLDEASDSFRRAADQEKVSKKAN